MKQNIPMESNDDKFVEPEDSHFLIYFIAISILCIGFYLIMCNKKKVIMRLKVFYYNNVR